MAWQGPYGCNDSAWQQPAPYPGAFPMHHAWYQQQYGPGPSPHHAVHHHPYLSAGHPTPRPPPFHARAPLQRPHSAQRPPAAPITARPPPGSHPQPAQRPRQPTAASRQGTRTSEAPQAAQSSVSQQSSEGYTFSDAADQRSSDAAKEAEVSILQALAAHAVQAIVTGATELWVFMGDCNAAPASVIQAATADINASCTHLAQPLAFCADDRTVSGVLRTANNVSAATWFLDLYMKHHPLYDTLPLAHDMLGRGFDPVADDNSAPPPRDHRTYIRGHMAHHCRDDWLVLFPYVCALDWEVTPGIPQNGR
jgi:hypothetical protein